MNLHKLFVKQKVLKNKHVYKSDLFFVVNIYYLINNFLCKILYCSLCLLGEVYEENERHNKKVSATFYHIFFYFSLLANAQYSAKYELGSTLDEYYIE